MTKGKIKKTVIADWEKWKNIHSDFSDQSIVELWTNNGFDYGQTKEWAAVLGNHFSPCQSDDFVNWMKNEQITPDWALNCGDIDSLNREYCVYLETNDNNSSSENLEDLTSFHRKQLKNKERQIESQRRNREEKKFSSGNENEELNVQLQQKTEENEELQAKLSRVEKILDKVSKELAKTQELSQNREEELNALIEEEKEKKLKLVVSKSTGIKEEFNKNRVNEKELKSLKEKYAQEKGDFQKKIAKLEGEKVTTKKELEELKKSINSDKSKKVLEAQVSRLNKELVEVTKNRDIYKEKYRKATENISREPSIYSKTPNESRENVSSSSPRSRKAFNPIKKIKNVLKTESKKKEKKNDKSLADELGAAFGEVLPRDNEKSEVSSIADDSEFGTESSSTSHWRESSESSASDGTWLTSYANSETGNDAGSLSGFKRFSNAETIKPREVGRKFFIPGEENNTNENIESDFQRVKEQLEAAQEEMQKLKEKNAHQSDILNEKEEEIQKLKFPEPQDLKRSNSLSSLKSKIGEAVDQVSGKLTRKPSRKELVIQNAVLSAENTSVNDEKLKLEYQILRERELIEKKNAELEEEAKELSNFFHEFGLVKSELEEKLRLVRFENIQKLLVAHRQNLEILKKNKDEIDQLKAENQWLQEQKIEAEKTINELSGYWKETSEYIEEQEEERKQEKELISFYLRKQLLFINELEKQKENLYSLIKENNSAVITTSLEEIDIKLTEAKLDWKIIRGGVKLEDFPSFWHEACASFIDEEENLSDDEDGDFGIDPALLEILKEAKESSKKVFEISLYDEVISEVNAHWKNKAGESGLINGRDQETVLGADNATLRANISKFDRTELDGEKIRLITLIDEAVNFDESSSNVVIPKEKTIEELREEFNQIYKKSDEEFASKITDLNEDINSFEEEVLEEERVKNFLDEFAHNAVEIKRLLVDLDQNGGKLDEQSTGEIKERILELKEIAEMLGVEKQIFEKNVINWVLESVENPELVKEISAVCCSYLKELAFRARVEGWKNKAKEAKKSLINHYQQNKTAYKYTGMGLATTATAATIYYNLPEEISHLATNISPNLVRDNISSLGQTITSLAAMAFSNKTIPSFWKQQNHVPATNASSLYDNNHFSKEEKEFYESTIAELEWFLKGNKSHWEAQNYELKGKYGDLLVELDENQKSLNKTNYWNSELEQKVNNYYGQENDLIIHGNTINNFQDEITILNQELNQEKKETKKQQKERDSIIQQKQAIETENNKLKNETATYRDHYEAESNAKNQLAQQSLQQQEFINRLTKLITKKINLNRELKELVETKELTKQEKEKQIAKLTKKLNQTEQKEQLLLNGLESLYTEWQTNALSANENQALINNLQLANQKLTQEAKGLKESWQNSELTFNQTKDNLTESLTKNSQLSDELTATHTNLTLANHKVDNIQNQLTDLEQNYNQTRQELINERTAHNLTNELLTKQVAQANIEITALNQQLNQTLASENELESKYNATYQALLNEQRLIQQKQAAEEERDALKNKIDTYRTYYEEENDAKNQLAEQSLQQQENLVNLTELITKKTKLNNKLTKLVKDKGLTNQEKEYRLAKLTKKWNQTKQHEQLLLNGLEVLYTEWQTNTRYVNEKNSLISKLELINKNLTQELENAKKTYQDSHLIFNQTEAKLAENLTKNNHLSDELAKTRHNLTLAKDKIVITNLLYNNAQTQLADLQKNYKEVKQNLTNEQTVHNFTKNLLNEQASKAQKELTILSQKLNETLTSKAELEIKYNTRQQSLLNEQQTLNQTKLTLEEVNNNTLIYQNERDTAQAKVQQAETFGLTKWGNLALQTQSETLTSLLARPNITQEAYLSLLNNQNPANLPVNWESELTRITNLESRPDINITKEEWENDYKNRPTQQQLTTAVTAKAAEFQNFINSTDKKELETSAKNLLGMKTAAEFNEALSNEQANYQGFINPTNSIELDKAAVNNDYKTGWVNPATYQVGFINPTDATAVAKAGLKPGNYVNPVDYLAKTIVANDYLPKKEVNSNYLLKTDTVAIEAAAIAIGLKAPDYRKDWINPIHLESEAAKKGMFSTTEFNKRPNIAKEAFENDYQKRPTQQEYQGLKNKLNNLLSDSDAKVKLEQKAKILLNLSETDDLPVNWEKQLATKEQFTAINIAVKDYESHLKAKLENSDLTNWKNSIAKKSHLESYEIKLNNLGLTNLTNWEQKVQSWKDDADKLAIIEKEKQANEQKLTNLQTDLKNSLGLNNKNFITWQELIITLKSRPTQSAFATEKTAKEAAQWDLKIEKANHQKENNYLKEQISKIQSDNKKTVGELQKEKDNSYSINRKIKDYEEQIKSKEKLLTKLQEKDKISEQTHEKIKETNYSNEFAKVVIGGVIYYVANKKTHNKFRKLTDELKTERDNLINEITKKTAEIQKLTHDYNQLETNKNHEIDATKNLLKIEQDNHQATVRKLQDEQTAFATEKTNSDKELSDLKISNNKYKEDWQKERNLRVEKEQVITNLKTQVTNRDVKIQEPKVQKESISTEQKITQELNNSLRLNLPLDASLSQAITLIKKLIAKPPTIIDNTQSHELIQNPLEFLTTAKTKDLAWLKGILSQRLYIVAKEEINNQEFTSYSQIIEVRNKFVKEQLSQNDNKLQLFNQENNSLVRKKNVLSILLAIGLLGVAILIGKLRTSQTHNKRRMTKVRKVLKKS